MPKLLANLGDDDFLTSGGFFVFLREDGSVYADIVVQPEDPQAEDAQWTVSRLELTPVFHIEDEWWGRQISSVCTTCDRDLGEFRHLIRSTNPMQRALAYEDLVGYFGPYQFDQEPFMLTKGEVTDRYREAL